MKLNKTIIGALHLAPLLGYSGCPGKDEIIRLALDDLKSFQEGGIDAIIYENNYDLPHTEKISDANYQLMLAVGKKLNEVANVPLGVNVLWNDYKSALNLAKELNLSFVRVPVLVDDVETSYGTFFAPMKEVLKYRTKIGADNTLIYADIHVKHSKIVSDYTIEESAKLAIDVGADGLIITGRWTGDSPDTDDLKRVRRVVGKFPIIIGSGADKNNIKVLTKYADAVIVSTSLKQGPIDSTLTNLSEWSQRISSQKTREFMNIVKR